MRWISRCAATEIDVKALLMRSRSSFQSFSTANHRPNTGPASPSALKLVIELGSIACDAMTRFKTTASRLPRDTFQTGRCIRRVFKRNIRVTLTKKRTDRVVFDDAHSETRELSHAQGLGRRIAHKNYSGRIDIRRREHHELLTLGRHGDGRPSVFLPCFGIFHGSRPGINFSNFKFDAEFSLDQAHIVRRNTEKPAIAEILDRWKVGIGREMDARVRRQRDFFGRHKV